MVKVTLWSEDEITTTMGYSRIEAFLRLKDLLKTEGYEVSTKEQNNIMYFLLNNDEYGKQKCEVLIEYDCEPDNLSHIGDDV